jgi:hypothetical protein
MRWFWKKEVEMVMEHEKGNGELKKVKSAVVIGDDKEGLFGLGVVVYD